MSYLIGNLKQGIIAIVINFHIGFFSHESFVKKMHVHLNICSLKVHVHVYIGA